MSTPPTMRTATTSTARRVRTGHSKTGALATHIPGSRSFASVTNTLGTRCTAARSVVKRMQELSVETFVMSADRLPERLQSPGCMPGSEVYLDGSLWRGGCRGIASCESAK
jgi:hypothetical protein